METTQIRALMAKLEGSNKLPLIEVHALFPYGPSLLNRDFNGRVKSGEYQE